MRRAKCGGFGAGEKQGPHTHSAQRFGITGRGEKQVRSEEDRNERYDYADNGLREIPHTAELRLVRNDELGNA
jgi:hypothetical protein